MNKLCCLIIMFFTCLVCKAQNLVPNGDFEQYSGCPNFFTQIDSSLFWMNPTIGFSGGGTPDYYNQCCLAPNSVGVPYSHCGFQIAHSGGAYAGIFIWISVQLAREYIEAPLISPLIANTCYHFEMYINLPDSFKYTSDAIGVYFSDTAITGINNWLPLPYIPQINNVTGNMPDSSNWTLVSGNYTAIGGESYLIIGNFKNDSNTTVVVANNNATWTIDESYFFIDDVSLCPCSNPCTTDIQEQNKNASTKIYPNPINGKLNAVVNNDELCEIILYDIAFRKLLQQSFVNSISINTEQLAKGIYLYEVRNKNGVIKKGKVVKN